MLHRCYIRSMSKVGVRDLRNDTRGVLSRVAAGERVVITVRGVPVAELRSLEDEGKTWLPSATVLARLTSNQADAGLRDDLARLAGGTLDDLRDQG